MSFTYLLGQGEESSAACFSDIPASVLSRLNLIPGPSCSSANAMESCRGSRSGTMSALSMDGPGEDSLMSCAGDFPARILVQPGRGPESPESGAACGPRWPGSLARFDHDTRSWRTAQCSLFGGLELFSETWPRWGMMQDGESFPLPTPAHLIDGNESGLWPTPQKSQMGKPGPKSRMTLDRMIQWPTPVKYDATPGGPGNHYHGLGYMARQGLFPTPLANCSTGAGTQGRDGGPNLQTVCGGQLNPPWVEWLMGWPIEWTALQPLAMDRFRQWLHSHGGCSPAPLDAGPGIE